MLAAAAQSGRGQRQILELAVMAAIVLRHTSAESGDVPRQWPPSIARHLNVTVIDLSDVPFEVLSITVSLISSVAHFGINLLQFGMQISDYWCYIGIPILHIKHRNCRVNRFRHHRASTE
ncbi:hypothetical protein F2P46_01645 [Massilia sp. CCM 8734]|nr:hypothetical protein [Massilia sp. CCM 8734]